MRKGRRKRRAEERAAKKMQAKLDKRLAADMPLCSDPECGSKSTHLIIDDQPCDEVLAIIGMCGAGVAYVDSIELVKLTKEERH